MAITTSDGTVIVDLVLDAAGAVRGARTASGEVLRFESGAKRAEGALGRLSGALKGLVATYVVGRLGQIARGLYEIATASVETESKFRTVFGSMSDRVDAFGEEWANTAGQTQNEFRDLAANVGAVVRGFGLAEGASADFSVEVLKLAGDLQSFHNVPIEETFAALRSGLTGEQEPLKRFGILLTEAETKQRAATVAAREHISASSAQALALARLELITEKAGVAVGDLARTQDSASNVGRRLAAQWREARDVFAGELIGAIQDLQGRIATFVGDGEGLKAWAKETGRQVGELVTNLADLGDALAALGTQLGVDEIWGDDVLGLEEFNENVREGAAELRWLQAKLADVTVWIGKADLAFARFQNGLRGGALSDSVKALEEGQRNLEANRDAAYEAYRALTALGKGMDDASDKANNLAYAAAAASGELAQMAVFMATTNGEALSSDEAFSAMLNRVLGLRQALGGGANGGGGGTTKAVREFKTALEQAAEEAANLRRALDDLHATDPERLAAVRAETVELQRQIDAYNQLVEMQLRRIHGTSKPGKGTRVEGAGPTTPTEGVNAEDVAAPAHVMEQAFIDAETGIAAALIRVQNAISDFTGIAGADFAEMGAAFGLTLDALGSAAGDFFEASGRQSEAAFRWQKRIATAQAIVSTLAAANNALAEVHPFPLNLAAAAAILAAGYARVRAINAQQIGGGAGAGAAGGGASVAPSGVANLAAGLSLQGRGQPAPVVNVETGGTTVNVKGRSLDHLIEEIDVREDVRGKALGNVRGL